MSTRAASATASLRAKQNLIRLLFNSNNTNNYSATTISSSLHQQQTTTQNHNYTYLDLRKAYLQRIQELHPDKHYSSTSSSSDVTDKSIPNQLQPAQLFVQIQEAWKLYDSFVKTSICNVKSTTVNQSHTSTSDHHHHHHHHTTTTKQYHTNDHHDDPNFTLFGVGCSFADNEQERNYRIYIMDQASRGFFTSGELSSSSIVASSSDREQQQVSNENNTFRSKSTTSSITSNHDDEYTYFDENIVVTKKANQHDNATKTACKQSLVAHLIPPHRRRPLHEK